MSEDDPRARWQALPARVQPQDWVEDHDEDPVPGAILDAPDVEQQKLVQWGVGLL